MSSQTILMIIDMQYDFCSPEGSLYVRGAEDDALRLANFITANEDKIDNIILTQDNHNVIDISHPVFWEDSQGKPPEPFTTISLKKILDGEWKPRFNKGQAVEYIRKLEAQGEFPHTIWPEHCILGSRGAAIIDEVLDPVRKWSLKGRFFEIIVKGTNPLTEHFGALKANVPISGHPETHLNTVLANRLVNAGKIYIAGEARSHCVATTIKQMLHLGGIARKLVILEDCMSDVTGFHTIALPIYKRARDEGASFSGSTELIQ